MITRLPLGGGGGDHNDHDDDAVVENYTLSAGLRIIT